LTADNFVVGTTSGYAPYVSLDEEGQYVGFDIDFARLLAKKLDRTLVIKDLGSMPSLFLALNLGKIDAIIWAISITEERQKQVEMIYYQGQRVESMPLLFWKKIPDKVSSLEDLATDPNAIVCVEAGSFQETVLKSVPNLSLKQVDKVMDAILELKFGKATATMIDPSLLTRITKQFSELQMLPIALPASLQSKGNGICIAKENQLLSEYVQKAVLELHAEGQITALENRWNLEGT
jgi:ABC-type amino acid transport substrate-binding protein